MERSGFFLTLAAGFFSVFLIGWQGYHGASADWVYGFLAVFWSLIMMLRLMTLTAPAAVGESGGLAQKLIGNFRLQQEENRQAILENSFGGSYLLFLAAGFVFAAWQVFCAAFPSQSAAFNSLDFLMREFFAGTDSRLQFFEGRVFDWGQGFLLLLALAMMGFVLRSHAAQKGLTRPALLILSAYAVSGYIAFAGLGNAGEGVAVAQADIVGNGSGAASFLLGAIPEGKTLSLFDIVLLESGIAGLAILTFILFIPLGYISLSAQNTRTDWMIVGCGMLAGSVLILSVFLSFTPALGGFMGLCWMALFLAWGASENNLLTKEQK